MGDCACAGQVTVRDLYKERDCGRFKGSFEDLVDAHGVLALKLTPTRFTPPALIS